MTRHVSNPDPSTTSRHFTGPDWRWLLVLGAVLIVGAVLAFLNPFAASLTAVAIAGSIFVLGGVLQLWIAFQYQGPSAARLVAGLLGLLVLVFGVALVANPLAGIVSLTLLIAGFFLAMGVLRIWLGFHLRDRTGWGWLVAAGAVSVLLGLLIVLAMPEAAAGLLGLFLGVDLLSSGVGMTVLALRMR
ncbi:HdeD family acid-resistance protein [Salipiger abyssi]|uniref:HdeD family acid-resistance protein n=1 Tax=Salipiger abyssi TaxID=1250539 RepID=UPI001A8D298C|nr:HdeD family acid-resistance protein [Salipiger abyssi]MBN9886707.1 HdeD family acid-resistance protein [Salipiger abyssi]